MEVKTYTIDEIKNIVTPIAEKYQIAQVYLFGSFARGDFDEQSDICLLYTSPSPRDTR